MKKRVLIGAILVLTFSMMAAAWDVLGHAYIMEQIKGEPGQANGNELYGITAPDFVNYLIGGPYYDYLYSETHKDFMRVWYSTVGGMRGTAEKYLAFGFVAHNGDWGADYTAHVSALTTGDTTKGYVITQAIFLNQVFDTVAVDEDGHTVWQLLGIPAGMSDLRLELCHNIAEYVIDIQIWSNPDNAGIATGLSPPQPPETLRCSNSSSRPIPRSSRLSRRRRSRR